MGSKGTLQTKVYIRGRRKIRYPFPVRFKSRGSRSMSQSLPLPFGTEAEINPCFSPSLPQPRLDLPVVPQPESPVGLLPWHQQPLRDSVSSLGSLQLPSTCSFRPPVQVSFSPSRTWPQNGPKPNEYSPGYAEHFLISLPCQQWQPVYAIPSPSAPQGFCNLVTQRSSCLHCPPATRQNSRFSR